MWFDLMCLWIGRVIAVAGSMAAATALAIWLIEIIYRNLINKKIFLECLNDYWRRKRIYDAQKKAQSKHPQVKERKDDQINSGNQGDV